jgi:4-amino-4-deoxy-L-arabinose transferase-like glycosyltransferase
MNAYPHLQVSSALVYKNIKYLWALLAMAILSFLTTISLPYQGEEAVYTITSMEMAFHREWITPMMYGMNYGRPPLLNILMIPFGWYFGWEHILIISRVQTLLVTSGTILLLMWFVRRVFHHKALALFSALIYMSGDVLFRRGWLAYADPLFSFFVFAAIALLWIAVLEKNRWFLALGLLGLMASFLTKALTGYIFYAGAFLVLIFNRSHRKFLLEFTPLCLQAIGLLFPIIWYLTVSEGAHGGSMVRDIIGRFKLSDLGAYGLKVALFPLDVFLRWLPVSGMLLYFWFNKKTQENLKGSFKNKNIQTLFAIIGLNFLPYWLAPETHTRYLMPLYPLIAVGLGYSVLTLNEKKVKAVLILLSLMVVLRFGIGVFGFPYYEKHYRGNAEQVATDILSIVQDERLYTINDTDTAPVISVMAIIDAKLLPKAVLVRPPLNQPGGYLLSTIPNVENTTVKKKYILGRHSLYLLCRF